MNQLELLIQNVLSEKMDDARENVKQAVAEIVRGLLIENWDTSEVARLIATEDGLDGVRNATSGHNIRMALRDAGFNFEAHDIDPSQVHWGNVAKIVKGESGRYSDERPAASGWESEITPSRRVSHQDNVQYNRHGDPNDYTYDEPSPDQVAGEIFQDKLDRYRREY